MSSMWAIDDNKLEAYRFDEQALTDYVRGNDSPYELDSLCIVRKACLSPDSNFALLFIRNPGTRSTDYLLLRLSDMKLKRVEGMDGVEPYLGSLAGAFGPSIEWNCDYITIKSGTGIQVYRFE